MLFVVLLFPSQLLIIEMLRRRLEFTLGTSIAVMNQPIDDVPSPQRLVECIQGEVGFH
jgi:hypothetical protein